MSIKITKGAKERLTEAVRAFNATDDEKKMWADFIATQQDTACAAILAFVEGSPAHLSILTQNLRNKLALLSPGMADVSAWNDLLSKERDAVLAMIVG